MNLIVESALVGLGAAVLLGVFALVVYGMAGRKGRG